MSIGKNWCAGCKDALEKNAKAVAYKKVTKCGGEDLPIGSYCRMDATRRCSPARDKAAPGASSGHDPTETRGGRLLSIHPPFINFYFDKDDWGPT